MSPKSSSPTDFLTATDIYKFLICPHWPWFDRFGEAEDVARKRELTDGEVRRMDDGYQHEREVMQEVMKGTTVVSIAEKGDAVALFEATKQAMAEGSACIYQGTLMADDRVGRPDLLIRVDGASMLGNWHYIPVDIKSCHELKVTHRFQLALYAWLLERTQGVYPEKAGIINREHEEHYFDPALMKADLQDVVEKIDRIRKGEKPAPVVRKSCFDTSPWGAACLAYAQATNDIALLYSVDVRRVEAMRSLGIHTVDDAADMDVSSYAGAAEGLTAHGLETIKMQAKSLRDKIAFVRKPVALPETRCEIHFDIESDLPNDVDYLYGFQIRDEKGERYERFLADHPKDEGDMWKAFLKWLETLPPEYVVYHYAPYEPTRLRLLEGRYGGSPWLELFRSRMIDLKPYATKHLTLPLYFYSLKQICKFFGFSWRGQLQSGGASIDYYERWCESGDRSVLEEIVTYNEDDVRATAFLKDWLSTYAQDLAAYEPPYPWVKE
ncbi:MAG: TM0106 family RecB-like putative nuclease [Candidatus Uhrbacteria bacterium]|nr:TM0106 family RecB-like putative nuclease [Candidatus Uhrbacteria bacterium]